MPYYGEETDGLSVINTKTKPLLRYAKTVRPLRWFKICCINVFLTILVYNSNWTHKSQSLFYLATALHVSGVTITHLQEHKTTVTTPPTTHSNQFQLFHDSSRQQYGVTVTRCCSYSCSVLLKVGDSDARNM